MSEQMPPEFEWIKPGVKAVYNSKTHPVFGKIITFLDCPKLRHPMLDPNMLSSWVVSVDWFGADNPEYCLNFDKTELLTLTLTREQAEALLKGIEEIRWCCQNKPVTELGKQIEDKLK